MSHLPARPSLEQYRKQARELQRACAARNPDALDRIRLHPRFRKLTDEQILMVALTDAQLVVAREHGFPSWPKFAAHLQTLSIVRALDDPASATELSDPVSLFIEFASVPRHGWHASGTLEHAELIRSRYPHVARANIYAAAVVADENTVRSFLADNAASATAPGGPHGWDALTYLCFSRYLRLDPSRSEAFVKTARVLLDAGASANSGWIETTDDDPPRPFLESVLYAAAGLARHPGLTRLLLEYGADPNDEETCYHAPESYDNAVMQILIESVRCNERSLAWLAARKADWHDEKGLLLALEGGADPNYMTHWKYSPFQHSIRRDNGLVMIEMFLDHGADPYLRTAQDRRNAFQMAAYHGRGDILAELERRGFAPSYDGPTPELDALVAACAREHRSQVQGLIARNPDLRQQLLDLGGTLLARFAGAANLDGVRVLLDLGIPVNAPWPDGDPYFELARNSTALHVAAWRAHHDIVRELIARGANVNAIDPRGRTPLLLAVTACIDSYWKYRRKPDSVAALLAAGATTKGIKMPTGYDAIDELLGAAEN
ncbi:MAG TPA: ankyrin repeat domain-containing protein [Acidobacteriaceae bacterium]|nr:ankyrin repeat domain-containing protein [Acidobacteriaceae bacterium]